MVSAAGARNHALEAAKQGLVAATFEPTWWHKPFPMAPSAASSWSQRKHIKKCEDIQKEITLW